MEHKFKNKKWHIRKVYFGLRIRLILILSLVLLIVMALFTAFMVYKQSITISNENNEKASILAQNLSTISEYYLNKDKKETYDEMQYRNKLIEDEIGLFSTKNENALMVLLYNYHGKLVYSWNKKSIPKEIYSSTIKKYLNESKTKLLTFDVIDEPKRNEKDKVKNKYKMVMCPVIAKISELVKINDDFDKILIDSHTKSLSFNKRVQIYKQLWKKYHEILPESLDPKNYNEKTYSMLEWNLDILFFNLYKSIFSLKNYEVNESDRWLVNESWINTLNHLLSKALISKDITLIKKYDEKIITNLSKLREYGERFKYLGSLVVIYDLNQIQVAIYKHLTSSYISAISFYIISIIVIFWLTGIVLGNIKKLEQWASQISKGNFAISVLIKTNDEIGRLADVFQNMIYEIQTRYHLEKFVSRSTRSMIGQAKISKIDVGPIDRKNFAFIFSDIRGFTSFSETHDPELVISILNLYFDIQSKIIIKYKGDIDDFVGDQIMAHFGGKKKADTAVNVATEIMRVIKKLNDERVANNEPIFEVGIGIHVGDVVIGNVGTDFRMDFACIGDAVNTTSRLCQIAKASEIIASKNVIKELSKKVDYKKLESVTLKGKKEPFEIFAIQWGI